MAHIRSISTLALLFGLFAFQIKAADPTGATLGREGEWVRGWALDTDEPSAKVQIHFYMDSSKGKIGSLVGQATARYDHDALDGTDRQGHAFFFRLPESARDGRPHTLQPHGLNVGPGKNAPLGEPLMFQLEVKPSRAAPETTIWIADAAFERTQTLSLDDHLARVATASRAQTSAPRKNALAPPHTRCCPTRRGSSSVLGEGRAVMSDCP